MTKLTQQVVDDTLKLYLIYVNNVNCEELKIFNESTSLETMLEILALICQDQNSSYSFMLFFYKNIEELFDKKSILLAIKDREDIPFLIEDDEKNILLQYCIHFTTKVANQLLTQNILSYATIGNILRPHKYLSLYTTFVNSVAYFNQPETNQYDSFFQSVSEHFRKEISLQKIWQIFDYDNTFDKQGSLYHNQSFILDYLFKEEELYLINPILLLNLFIKHDNTYAIESLINIYKEPNSQVDLDSLINLFSYEKKKTMFDVFKDNFSQNIMDYFIQYYKPIIYHYFSIEESYQKQIKTLFEVDFFSNTQNQYYIDHFNAHKHIKNYLNYSLLCAAKSIYLSEKQKALQLNIIQFLLNNGANIHSREESTFYKTPLYLASENANQSVVLKLLDNKAHLFDSFSCSEDRNTMNQYFTPLHHIINSHDIDFLGKALSYTDEATLINEDCFYDFYHYILYQSQEIALEKFDSFYSKGLEFRRTIGLNEALEVKNIDLFYFFITNDKYLESEEMFDLLIDFFCGKESNISSEDKKDILEFILKNSSFDLNHISKRYNLTLIQTLDAIGHHEEDVILLESIKLEDVIIHKQTNLKIKKI